MPQMQGKDKKLESQEPASVAGEKYSMGPSIKYVTLFWQILTPLPLSHFVTHLGTLPHKVRHISEHPLKDCLASICTSVLCKERSYKYQITVLDGPIGTTYSRVHHTKAHCSL